MFEGLVNGYFKDFTAYPFSLEETDDRTKPVDKNNRNQFEFLYTFFIAIS